MTGFSAAQMQVIWNWLLGLAEEQGQTLTRAVFSPIVRECGDIAAVIFDRVGRMLSQTLTGMPKHINTMAEAVKSLMARFSTQLMRLGEFSSPTSSGLLQGI